MDIIPLIYVKNRKIIRGIENKAISLAELLEITSADEKIYVKDIDGIEKNKPNLNLYQKLSKTCELWVDAGPRVLGDVVDLVMAGANSLTLQTILFTTKDIPRINDVIDCDVYLGVQQESTKFGFPPAFLDVFAGTVIYPKENTEHIIFYESTVKKMLTQYKNKVYVVDDASKTAHWEKMGVHGVLIKLGKLKKKRRRA